MLKATVALLVLFSFRYSLLEGVLNTEWHTHSVHLTQTEKDE